VPNVAAGTSDGQRITFFDVEENLVTLQDRGAAGLGLEAEILDAHPQAGRLRGARLPRRFGRLAASLKGDGGALVVAGAPRA
jgi:hypothetical protein